MKRMRMWLALAGVTLLAVGAGRAEDEAKKPAPPRRAGVAFGARANQLLPARIANQLDLTAKQKEKIDELANEFAAKSGQIRQKIQAENAKARAQGQRPDRQTIRGLNQEIAKMRSDFQAKALEVLTKEQKKKYEEVRAAPLGLRPILGRNAGPGAVFTPLVQRQLNLTKEQKEKLAKLQAEMEKKALEVLTKEQKKKFEEIKKNPVRLRPGVRGIQIRPIQIRPVPAKNLPAKPKKP
jgi:Spy/CpxP family protein refolding chaperone